MKISKSISNYTDSFMELIYPQKNYCVVCNKYDEKIADSYICEECKYKFKLIHDPICQICGKQMLIESEDKCCDQCHKHQYSFIKNKSVYRYEGLIKKIIHDYKYLDKSYFHKFLANSLYEYMIESYYINFDIITSVPIHKSKLKKRGYNQAELIGKQVATKLEIPYQTLLSRQHKTTKQSELSKYQREKNIKKAFAICSKIDYNIIKDKSILIIDDIYTTGSTMEGCASVLKKAGAKAVYGLTVAR